MTDETVIVIGAGIGGLVAALELAARGRRVTVLEQGQAPGGKMRQIDIQGARIDAGPTVFTMKWVFEELLAGVGTSLDDELQLQPVEVLARHAWDGGGQLDLFADVERSVQAIAAFAGPGEGQRYRDFTRRARNIYRALERPYLRSQRPSPLGLVGAAGLGGLGGLLQISPYTTLWKALGEHFHDPRLRQLFGRYATYCGSSPFQAPATLMLVAHVEQEGVWLVEGGMHRLAATLARLAQERGASIRYGCPVAEILVRTGRAAGVRLADGEELPARAVVFNGDVAALSKGLLGSRVARTVPLIPRAARSLSALTWSMVAEVRGFPLLRHTVFFSRDYRAEFDDLLAGGLPAAPTVYLCAQDRRDVGDEVPEGPERLFCLVNAPPVGDTRSLTPEEIARCEDNTFALLARCGLKLIRQPDNTVVTTPADFHRLFPGTGGALYGQASHGWKSAFSRPGSISRMPGLYLAGGSVHPGPGVPMAALSGRLAAARLLADSTSTVR